MWAVKWFLAVVVILLVFGFALQNTQEITDVVFVKNVWQVAKVQLWMVIYLSFGLGVIFWLFVSVFQVLQLKSDIRKLHKKNHEMLHELESLRNLPISEDDAGFGIKEEA
ncbi:MAG: lipopolysaccharide assembly LapA domain-containing protein [bacterium]